MISDDDKFWHDVAGKLRKAKGLCPPSPDEADAAFDEAKEIPLSDDQIKSIVESVTSGEMTVWDPVPDDDWEDSPEAAAIGEQTLALHRSQGEDDPVTEQVEKDLEGELLNDGEPDENKT